MTGPTHTPEQAAILALLDRIEALEREVRRLSGLSAVRDDGPIQMPKPWERETPAERRRRCLGL